MKKTINIVFIILNVVLIIILVSKCHRYDTPPCVSSVKDEFLSNQDAINVIVEYMIDTGYEDIYISGADGSMLANLTKTQIRDDLFFKAVKQLIQSEEYIHISKNGNTIHFLQWRGITDIGCGIAYSINGVDAPVVQFMTVLEPISNDGWFYYVSDYNEWRAEQSMSSNG